MSKRNGYNPKRPKLPERECGECDVCCWALNVIECNAPEFTRCEYMTGCGDRRCGAYETRPVVCRRFACQWLKGLKLAPFSEADLRPDRAGLFLWMMPTMAWGRVLTATEAYPGGFSNPTAKAIIDASSARWLLILVHASGRRQIIGPRDQVQAAMEKLENKR
jgi:hypothetical protein